MILGITIRSKSRLQAKVSSNTFQKLPFLALDMLALVFALHVAFCSSMETQPRAMPTRPNSGPVVTQMVPESYVDLADSVAELGDAVASLAESLGQIPNLEQDQPHVVNPGAGSSHEVLAPSFAESLEAQPNVPGEPVAAAAAAEAHGVSPTIVDVDGEQFGVSPTIVDVDGEPDAEPVPGDVVAAGPIIDEIFELWY